MNAAPIRVVLIDDSAVVRGALRQILEAAPDIEVVATAPNGKLGLEELGRVNADVVLLDIEMPVLDGLSTLPLILAKYPRMRVIMASSLTQQGARVTMDALAMGAADYIAKPTARAGPAALAALADGIVEKIRAIGGAGRRRTTPTGRQVVQPRTSAPRLTPPSTRVSGAYPPSIARPKIVAIASSTGGPNALAAVLRSLPPSFRLPVMITQHMPPLFTELLAQRLQRESGRRCVEAKDGQPISEHHMYVAPGDFHMIADIRDGVPYIRLAQTPPENHCRPAADVMLRSVAGIYGGATLGVVLTGMGEDGRAGCELIRKIGGRVIAQDEATSVVWGMPGAVAHAGLAERIVPLNEIGTAIAAICEGRS